MSADEARLAEAKQQLSHLVALPVTPARVEAIPADELFKDRWARLGQRERNQWLRMSKVRALMLQDPLLVLLMSGSAIQESARMLTTEPTRPLETAPTL